ncbi:hypothetical protein PR202_gb03084 [Eleusine coracana subsp. coracana]|uniref:Eukaryotic translation initiation factor 3 subunit C N-terminal domain-containing protein n=1 Tax=Eleusine coracana subsp. coracana TaxID=191504 RepID=A0AAV5E0A1_ELECO|nr:hypothetical protein PR202_gb03084 [Eleusine coracana subsp. coracana]
MHTSWLLCCLSTSLFESLENIEAKKEMNSSNAKALNPIKQNLKKNNQQYPELILKCRENPKFFEKEDVNHKGKDDSDDEYDTHSDMEINSLASDKEKDWEKKIVRISSLTKNSPWTRMRLHGKLLMRSGRRSCIKGEERHRED